MSAGDPRPPHAQLGSPSKEPEAVGSPENTPEHRLCSRTRTWRLHWGALSLFSFEEFQCEDQRNLTTPTGQTFGRIISPTAPLKVPSPDTPLCAEKSSYESTWQGCQQAWYPIQYTFTFLHFRWLEVPYYFQLIIQRSFWQCEQVKLSLPPNVLCCLGIRLTYLLPGTRRAHLNQHQRSQNHSLGFLPKLAPIRMSPAGAVCLQLFVSGKCRVAGLALEQRSAFTSRAGRNRGICHTPAALNAEIWVSDRKHYSKTAFSRGIHNLWAVQKLLPTTLVRQKSPTMKHTKL